MREVSRYQPRSPAEVAALVVANPFALIVSNRDGVPEATHIPVVFRDEAEARVGREESLVGRRLLGHMAANNPQWRTFDQGNPVLLVVQGPHGYVSPSVYEVTPAAPTWNYASAHLLCEVSLLRGKEANLDVVVRTVEALERPRAAGWDMTESLGYFHKIVGGVQSFELSIREVRTTFKLSQDKSEELQDRVTASFAAGREDHNPELADLMVRQQCPHASSPRAEVPTRSSGA